MLLCSRAPAHRGMLSRALLVSGSGRIFLVHPMEEPGASVDDSGGCCSLPVVFLKYTGHSIVPARSRGERDCGTGLGAGIVVAAGDVGGVGCIGVAVVAV